jgi:hypothetical protein
MFSLSLSLSIIAPFLHRLIFFFRFWQVMLCCFLFSTFVCFLFFFFCCYYLTTFLDHASHESIDVIVSVTGITTFSKVTALELVSAKRRRELERPQESVGLLEVWSDSVQLVDEILDAQNVVLTKSLGDDAVVSDRNTLLVDLTVSALVHEFAHRLEGWVTVGDVRLDEGKHVLGSLVQLDKDTIVDLTQTQKLKNLLGLWSDTVDTTNTGYESDLWLIRDIEVTLVLGLTAKTDLVLGLVAVLLDVLLSALEDLGTDDLLVLLGVSDADSTLGADLVKSGAFLQKALWGRHDEMLKRVG